MKLHEWLTINFTLPKEPSRVRVSIWRKLKRFGSVNIGQSLWVLPPLDEHYALFEEISKEVVENHGEAYIMKTTFIQNENAKTIIEHFNAVRDEEYKEFLDKCDSFFKEINMETEKENFSYTEIEENEQELDKLNVWLEKILARDFFSAPLKKQCIATLSKCKQVMEDFSNKVYELNGAM